MQPDQVDNPKETVYDNAQNGTIVETVDLNNRPNLIDTDHEHTMVRDNDETEDYYSVKCSHPRCNRGMLISKHE